MRALVVYESMFGNTSSHGRWVPAEHRPDPVALLEEQAGSRVPELVPIRYAG